MGCLVCVICNFSSFHANLNLYFFLYMVYTILGPVAQLVTSLTADTRIARLIPAWSHTFMEIDHEISSSVILLLPIQEGLLSGTS